MLQAADDETEAAPGDEYRNILPKPDDMLTIAFLHGDHCLTGVSMHFIPTW